MKKIIFACGIITALLWLSLTFISRGLPVEVCRIIDAFTPAFMQGEIYRMANGFYYDVANRDTPQIIFIVLFTCAFAIYFWLILLLRKKKAADYTVFIIPFAIIFRFILLPGVLIHENDIYRYIWDGKVLAAYINPYKYAPEVKDGDVGEIKKFRILKKENPTFFYRMSYRHIPTIYPPFAQIIFWISTLIKRNSIIGMKTIFVIFDILSIFVIWRLLLFLKMNPNMLIVYAWSPLVLKEFANSGHLDPIPIFFLLCAIFFVLRGRFLITAVSLSLGILSKLFPLVTVPVFLKKMRPVFIIWLSLLIGTGYMPFLLMGNVSPFQIFTGLVKYVHGWAVNGGVFEFLYSLVYAVKLNIKLSIDIFVKIILAVSYITVLFFIITKKITDDRTFIFRVFLCVAFLFLLSPVGDPWYFCWVIPFLCFFPYMSFIVFSWLIIFSYLYFTSQPGYIGIGTFKVDILILIQYLPFYILLFLEALCIKIKRLRC